MVNVTMWDAQSIVRVAAFSWMESRQVFQREQQLSKVFQESRVNQTKERRVQKQGERDAGWEIQVVPREW